MCPNCAALDHINVMYNATHAMLLSEYCSLPAPEDQAQDPIQHYDNSSQYAGELEYRYFVALLCHPRQPSRAALQGRAHVGEDLILAHC